MNFLRSLLHTFQQDRLLQIAVAAFLVLLMHIYQRPVSEGRVETSTRLSPAELVQTEFDPNSREPFIVELPADEETVAQTVVALLSGREVLVKDEKGNWRRMEPSRGPDGPFRIIQTR